MNLNNHNILLAPNSFKGSLNAFEFCRILATELEECGFHTISLPLGDGGDGTARIVAHYLHASPIKTKTVDALGREHFALYYLKEHTAIIELAEACGLKHLKREEYDILNTNTAGFGILINHAISQGANNLILCVGGSASIDGGTGALREMGLTIANNSTNRNYIIDIKSINVELLQQKFKGIHITILCDVDNSICGPEGAAAVFAPQKGASPEQVVMLDKQLALWSDLLKQNTGKDITHLKHGGAAGGITAAMHALLNVQLVSGSEFCLTLSHFHDYLLQAGVVITGEGKIDLQSFYGKIPGTIADLCQKQNVPVYAVVGLAEKQVLSRFDKVFTMSKYARSVQDSIKNAPYYLKIIAQAIVDTLYLSAYSD
ncbi:MAG TPA: glycerate kinase [Candidatus Butyricimonas faecavium]|nr:glycerate kinase [Candidatus Butyricimonas faecavium]